jgi:putative transposase
MTLSIEFEYAMTDTNCEFHRGNASDIPVSAQAMDFVFDRIASGRTFKNLVIVDDATHEVIATEFTGKSMLTWAHRHRHALRLIEPGNQNAYVESLDGRLHNECLNEHGFTSLAHARAVIETWRREYNDERPKKSLGGITPSQYAKQLARKAVTMPEDSKAICY